MLQDTLAHISTFTILSLSSQFGHPIMPDRMLSSHEFSLENRYPWVQSVNTVMKDNILLNLAYMDGRVGSSSDINWDEIEKAGHFSFKLDPNQTFAFHDDVLPEFKGKISKTTNAHFNFQEGFKSDGYLYGDGVCHLASLIYWVSKDAGLSVVAPTRHDFMAIPEISAKNGVSIFNNPYLPGANSRQNLYITNNRGKPVTFDFDYNGKNLKVSVMEIN